MKKGQLDPTPYVLYGGAIALIVIVLFILWLF